MESNTVYGDIVFSRTTHGVQNAISDTRSEVKEVKNVKPVGNVMKVKRHVPDCFMTKRPDSGVIKWARDIHEVLNAILGIRWEVMEVEKVMSVGKVMQVKRLHFNYITLPASFTYITFLTSDRLSPTTPRHVHGVIAWTITTLNYLYFTSLHYSHHLLNFRATPTDDSETSLWSHRVAKGSALIPSLNQPALLTSLP